MGTVSGPNKAADGSSVTVTANPNTGYKFVSWTKDSETISQNPYTFTINADVTLVANFAVAAQYNITLNSSNENHGTVAFTSGTTDGQNVYETTTVEVTATPATGYKFVNWVDANDEQVSTQNPYSFKPTAATTLKAVFAKDPVTHGGSTQANAVALSAGTNIQLDAASEYSNKWYKVTVPAGKVATISASENFYMYAYNTGTSTQVEMNYGSKSLSVFAVAATTYDLRLEGNTESNVYTVEFGDPTPLSAGNNQNITDGWYKMELASDAIVVLAANNSYSVKVVASGMEDVHMSGQSSSNYKDSHSFVAGTYYLYFSYVDATSFDVNMISDVELTVGAAGLATMYYSDRELTVPAGVKAYTYAYNEEDGVFAVEYSSESQYGEYIPAGTGVVVKATPGDYTFTATTPTREQYNEIVCKGSDVAATTTGGDYYYAVQNGAHGYAWYWMEDNGAAFTNAAHKAYIALTEDQYNVQFPQSQDARMIPLFGDETTGINAASFGTEKNGKFIENGRVVIVKNGKKFNAAGQLMK